jgi:hypothetical protein
MIRINSKAKLDEYLKIYGSYYNKYQLDSIHSFFPAFDYHIRRPNDLFDEIAGALDIIKPSENYYLTISKMIGDLYSYNINILDVGAGIFPIFSKYIDDEQKKIGRGTITAMDPLIIDKKIGNIHLIKDEFTSSTNIDKYDLIVSIKPCTCTQEIITRATVSNKEFFIALCGCEPFEMFDYDYDMTREEWIGLMYYLARRQEENGFTVYMEDSLINYPYPVIFTKKK